MRATKWFAYYTDMAGFPARFEDHIDPQRKDPERPFRTLSFEEERIRTLEQKLLDASSQRIHEFERRLELEWLALRQLHEEPLKTLEQRTTAITENCLNIVREALTLARERIPEQPAEHPAQEPRALGNRAR